MKSLFIGACAVLLAGCEGRFASGPTPLIDPCAGVGPKVSVQPARRLTRREYLTTLKQLLPGTVMNEEAIPEDASGLTFDTDYGGRGTSEGVVDAWFANAERLAAVASLSSFLPCSLGANPTPCVDQFIAQFGRRAFRRALSTEERASLRRVYDEASSLGQSPEASVRVVLTAFLLSPQLLYRLERSLGDDGAVVALDPVEYATRISYFLWGAAPDEALLSAAEAGQLASREGLRAEVLRMVANEPRAREQVRNFHFQWAHLDKVTAATRDPTLFPTFGATRASMLREAELFFEDAFWNQGKLSDFLLTRRSFVDPPLATLYGVEHPGGTEFAPIDLPAAQRIGLLTLPALMTATANPNRTSPTRRGHFVVSQMLCVPIAPPPLGVELPPTPPGDTPKTVRERFAAHASNPACASCHRVMDPPGFILESYDAIGRFRATESDGTPIDTSAVVSGSDIDGPVGNVFELANKLATSKQAMGCVADQWMQFGLGKVPEADDMCARSTIRRQFEESNGDFRELLVSILDSQSFRYLKTEGAP